MKFFGAILIAAVLATAGLPAKAAQVHWKTPRIQYAVEGKPLKEVLRDFTASQGIAASIASGVEGSVSGKFSMSPQAFLETLALTFGFVWYYDGSLLEIAPASDVQSTILSFKYSSMDDLRMTLDRLALSDKRFPIVYDDMQHTAIVSGPPHYLQLVSNVARGLEVNASRLVGTQIRIFKLRHAWASDHDVQISGQKVSVTGVANVLNSLFNNNPDSAGSQTNVTQNLNKVAPMADVSGATGGPLMPPLPAGFKGGSLGEGGSLGAQMSAFLGVQSPGAQNNGNSSKGQTTGADGETNSGLPIIRADARTNSVLVRDLPGRMEQYAELIEKLDVKPKLIEIQANIIEVDDNALEQLGIDWRVHSGRVDIQTGNGKTEQTTFNNALNPNFGTTAIGTGQGSVNASPTGLSMTTLLGDSGRFLLARINALEQNNQAKIEASPKVTTLDNVEAVMDSQQQIHVRVQGYTAGQLYSISTGVSLRVLPMVVENGDKTQIKLEVSIEDGQFSRTQTVDSIPMVATTRINTQAFIGHGQSLLIAGYRNQQTGDNISGIPLLSKIPLIGGLFRYRDTSNTRREQLFLLTPRIIEL
ncbi:MAG: type III secretion protein C [Glomeribacter sp. 1016415]|uniref:Type 3 secretion system secretin n=1 Tax=Mycoavidus cysteinexigens TaxID=1553431 RepID=A0A2Z6EU44_9BURK|nr:type III secretion system outer membrane ring subunit SctC [Mycoavidus cysteinexigens]MCX8565406.1 type III secretion protein C [Glomeribacter sp. 1016415]BBE08936.1 Type III secretion outer membrane pore, YscC/HrcC family [Mycoavidus cysteinexigens]GAM52341.1 type III secretion outermembrane pore forming protein [bacterium endosymbiont of Mortierella elongata FMR23-6]GLR01220.1 EscC/YscC/HrcC family type III secretion system outer membrane ring protein [Mycoavidus cysteinexigens]